MKQKAENQARIRAGQEPLAEEDVSQMFKPPTQVKSLVIVTYELMREKPSRLDALLLTAQLNTYTRQINQFAGSALAKLFLLSGMQTPKEQ